MAERVREALLGNPSIPENIEQKGQVDHNKNVKSESKIAAQIRNDDAALMSLTGLTRDSVAKHTQAHGGQSGPEEKVKSALRVPEGAARSISPEGIAIQSVGPSGATTKAISNVQTLKDLPAQPLPIGEVITIGNQQYVSVGRGVPKGNDAGGTANQASETHKKQNEI